MIEQFTPKMFRQVWRNKTECGDLRQMGGYWNDSDQRGKDE